MREKPQIAIKSCLEFGVWCFSGAWSLVFGVCLLTSCTQNQKSAELVALHSYPPSIELTGLESRQSIVIQAEYSDGTTRDVTTEARPRIADSRWARLSLSLPKGRLTNSIGSALTIIPIANGSTELSAAFRG